MSTTSIDKATLISWLADGAELAVLDIRRAEDVGYASPLFATNLPAPRVEAELGRFVPRQVVRTVLIDDGSGTAQALVTRLRTRGWSNIVALEGGIPAWTAAPGEVLPTFDIPGVPFSVAVRDERGTPVTSARELAAAREQGEDVIVIDTRTVPEFANGHVPGAVSVPGAELVLRFKDVVPNEKTRVVVSCAGLPRAILGAQTLRDAGVPNPVSYLDDGTRAWTEAGFALEKGETNIFRHASEASEGFAKKHIGTLSANDTIPEIDIATAKAWQADPDRTTYVLDVRTPGEFEAEHLDFSISSEGGQLLGVAYRTIAVRGARVVLVDDLLGVRARTVAHWLQRRGYELAILLHPFGEGARAQSAA